MTAIPFDEHPSSQPSPAAWSDAPDGQPHNGDNKQRAVAKLLRDGVLSHVFGQHGEYRVRTTMPARQAWQYQCCVLRHGKMIKEAFFPIIVDRTPHMPHIRTEPGGSEAMWLSFAKEAVDVHFTRCAALREYLMLAAIYSQPSSQSRQRYTFLALLIGMALLTAYGLWAYAFRTDSGQPPGNPPPPVQGATYPVIDRRPLKAPWTVPLHASSGTASRDIIDERAGAARLPRVAEMPQSVRLNDLIAPESPSQNIDHTPREPTPRVSPGSTAPDVRAGDLLLLTGWVHRVSRAPDSAYRLQVSPSPKAAAPGLVAVVPSPDQAADSPAERTQLQTVRAFITRQLLRQREPSPQGSVIQRPIFVQLTGQLSYPDTSLGKPSQGKRPRDATARWEVRPVVDIRFATPPVPSNRSRPK
jgi:hypothetical protein